MYVILQDMSARGVRISRPPKSEEPSDSAQPYMITP